MCVASAWRRRPVTSGLRRRAQSARRTEIASWESRERRVVGLQGEGGTRPPSPWSPTTRHPAVSRVVVTSRRYRYRYHYFSLDIISRHVYRISLDICATVPFSNDPIQYNFSTCLSYISLYNIISRHVYRISLYICATVPFSNDPIQ